MANRVKEYKDRVYPLDYNVDTYKLWWKNICYRSNTTGWPASNSINNYASNLLVFLKYYSGSIITVTIDDIFEFFDSKDPELSSNTKSEYIVALLDYITFLKDNNALMFHSKTVAYRFEVNKASHSIDAINLDEFIQLRNKFKQNNKYYNMMVLDLIYYYGLTLEDLNHCRSENYSFEKSCFIIKGRHFYVDDQLEENIIACFNSLDSNNEKDHLKCISKMGDMFNKHFSWKSIYNLRQKHLITCPSCSNSYVNDSKFWVLAQRKNDVFNTKVLVCRNCAKKYKG